MKIPFLVHFGTEIPAGAVEGSNPPQYPAPAPVVGSSTRFARADHRHPFQQAQDTPGFRVEVLRMLQASGGELQGFSETPGLSLASGIFTLTPAPGSFRVQAGEMILEDSPQSLALAQIGAATQSWVMLDSDSVLVHVENYLEAPSAWIALATVFWDTGAVTGFEGYAQRLTLNAEDLVWLREAVRTVRLRLESAKGRLDSHDISIQDLYDNKVDLTDPRLTDSREWIEDTVSQAEAEAGISATRRAWTAQRIWQAIYAQWLSVTSTLGRTLVGRGTAAEMRGDLELGSAATRNVGASTGNVVVHGTESLIVIPSNTDLDTYAFSTLASPTYYIADNTLINAPLPNLWWNIKKTGHQGWVYLEQLSSSGRTFKRYAGADGTLIGPWIEIQTTANTGTSVNYDVTTSSVATTPNRLLKTGDFGLGNAIVLPQHTDLDQVLVTGFYRCDNPTGNLPSGAQPYGLLLVIRGLNTISQTYVDHISGRQYTRAGNPPIVGGGGFWSAWRKTLNDTDVGTSTGNVMPVGAFGLGTGKLLENGDRGVFATTYDTVPSDFANIVPEYSSLILSAYAGDDRYGFLFSKRHGVPSDAITASVKESGAWRAPVTLLHTGNTFIDASGVLTNQSGALSNTISDLLSQNTAAGVRTVIEAAPSTHDHAGYVRELTQGSNTGVATPYRIANPSHYGNIGNRAVDLSYKSSASSTHGAVGMYATALGVNPTASGNSSTAMGQNTIASGYASTATGAGTGASGMYSVSMGANSYASSRCAVSIGKACEVGQDYYVGLGYAATTPTPNGTNQNLTIAFDYQNGNGYFDGSADLGNADYAEYFETYSGQSIDVGYFVSWVEGTDKIEAGNNDVVGIVSAAPAVVGDSASLHWTNKYVKDEFDRVQWHDVEVEEVVGIDDNGNEITETKVMRDRVPNPDYDPSIPYVPRSERPEWIPVGLLGKLWVRTDDSSIKVGDKVEAGSDGKAVKGTSWRVIGVRDGLVKVLFR